MNHFAYRQFTAAAPLVLAAFLLLPNLAAASTNLVQNPSFTASSTPTTPANWIPIAWGAASTTSTFSYPVAGQDDSFAAQVTISAYSATGLGNGSAEWLPDVVTVTPGALYTFSDWYKSDTNSYVSVQWTLTGGSTLTETVATLGPTAGQWVNETQIFSAPTNAVSATLVHSIQSVGTLTVDNVSFSAGADSIPGSLTKAIVSLTFDNAYTSQYVNAFPILKALQLPATYYVITNQIRSAIYDFFTDPTEAITTATTSTSVTWSPILTDPTVQSLIFSDTYTSAATSTVEADYLYGSVASSTILGELPAGTGAQAKFTFALPLATTTGKTVTPISIVHSSAGALTASNPSLTENIPQHMTISQLLEVQAARNEIGSHTVTHGDLTATTTAGVQFELANSRSALGSWGISPADGFAYPFGNYNTGIESQTAGVGYIHARTVDVGYNTALTDKFALKSQSLVKTTPFSDVKSWIDTAIANKLWLIITFHDVDNQATLDAFGETYGTTPQIMQQIADYLNSQSANVQVLSVHDALSHLSTTTEATSTPPVVNPPVVSSGGGGGGGGGSILAGGSSSPNPLPWTVRGTETAAPSAVIAPAIVPKVEEPAAGSVLGEQTFKFARHLSLRSRGADVTALQNFLIDSGFRIPAGASGYFGVQTKSAVIAFQKANGLPRTGYVGPLTLALLNKGSGLAFGR
jgi:peptidoglycan/xylan/chitin deacetylase (PgdA/CDA1 family)